MFAIAPTDTNWFEFMRDEFRGDLANFWTPTPWGVRKLSPGDRLYFLRKAPIRKVAGYGIFRGYEAMTREEAWERYGTGNGVNSLAGLTERVGRWTAKNSKVLVNSTSLIGSIELTDIVTLAEAEYVDPNRLGALFPRQVVKLKYFNGVDRLLPDAPVVAATGTDFDLVTDKPDRRYFSRKHRPGQAAFRNRILSNYGKSCAISGVSVVDLLEASHIQPYVNRKSDHPQNGICLRVDLHRLFDAGLMTIDATNMVVVSPQLAGTDYAHFNGGPAKLPAGVNAPSRKAMEEHRAKVFRK